MVKAQDFWNYVCKEKGYRFFAGVPCVGLSKLYEKMSSEFMHYVPAVNEHMAVSMVNGARLAGINSAVLMEANIVNKLDFSFNLDNSFPLLIIASSAESPRFKREVYSLEFIDDFSILDRMTKHITSKGKPGILFVKEGTIQ